MVVKVVIGSDHAGFKLKEKIKEYLVSNLRLEVIDVGTHSEEPCDYPDYAVKAVKQYFALGAKFGILICGTGIGMSIVANKFKGVRAAVAYAKPVAELSRRHNHANFLCLGARFLREDEALDIVKAWLSTSEEGGRHERRVNKIKRIEEELFR